MWVVGIIIVVIVVLSINKTKSQDLSKISEIKIGSILIQTGDGASWGEASQNGINLAIKEINANGGILGKKVVAVHEDDQGDPAKTVGAFRKLTNTDNIDFIIGPSWTKNGLAIKDLIDDEIVISPSLGNAQFNETSEFIFNTYPHDYILSEKLADEVFAKGFKNVAILGANDVWVKEQTESFKQKFEKNGGTVSFVFEPQTDQRDLRTDLLKIKDKNIDAIVITSDGYGITSLYGRQMQELGIKQPVYGITLDSTVIANCLGACDGWIYLSALTPTSDFEAKYKKEYNREIEVGADSAYDAMMLIAKGISETKSIDPNVVQKYLNKLDMYEGASGVLTSDGKGAFTKEFATMGIKDSKPFNIK